MNVLRMIKLFGWEQQVEREMDAKRQEELKMQWQRSLLGLLNGILKSDGFHFHKNGSVLTRCSLQLRNSPRAHPSHVYGLCEFPVHFNNYGGI